MISSIHPPTHLPTQSIYEESAKLLYKEIDYENEGRNAERFANDFKDIPWVRTLSSHPPTYSSTHSSTYQLPNSPPTHPPSPSKQVKVPKIYWDFTSKRVLAMEYCPGTFIHPPTHPPTHPPMEIQQLVPTALVSSTTPTHPPTHHPPTHSTGIKVSDIQKIEAAGIDRQLLAKRSAESYLFQLCRHGFFHCDPHPGNVACDNYMGGRLIYYDFGTCRVCAYSPTYPPNPSTHPPNPPNQHPSFHPPTHPPTPKQKTKTGMMDEFRPEVKKGLVDLIFSVYEGDAKATCDAMEDVGILRRGADRVSVEKIAR